MLNKLGACVFFLLTILSAASAQQLLPIATNFKKAYATGTRSHTGVPGHAYWQNTADYAIKIGFNPLTRQLKGSVAISYINNSPDTLSRIVFKLNANLYKKSSPRAVAVEAEDLTDGVNIEKITQDGLATDAGAINNRGTNMYVDVHKILPGEKAYFNIMYSYTLNKGSFIRTGQIDTGAFFIAYFFPRIAVYDDIDGWNIYPYTGQVEFYNDYGKYAVEITVLGSYQVWATGSLTNKRDVYEPKYADRIDEAERSSNVVDIIDTDNLKAGHITNGNGSNTWKFEADSITDFAFGISNHYVWRSTSVVADTATKRRARIDAVYNPEHLTYQLIIGYAGKTVEAMVHYFPKLPFPYSHITVFDGPDVMEFPMMVDNNPFELTKDAIQLTAHEIFHTIFPFLVGTNETKYSFMDEGWATMAEFYLSPIIDPQVPVAYDMSDINTYSGTEQDVPVMTLTPQLAGKARFTDKDQKPALGYLYVKEMLGDELFLKALHFYIDNWKGRHPTPYDFFNCINTASGVNLNWFWKNWFFEKWIPDLAITNVVHSGKNYTVTISNAGGAFVPVHVTVFYIDGSKEMLGKSIACWASGTKSVSLKFVAKKQVKEIVLGTVYDADIDKANNVWKP